MDGESSTKLEINMKHVFSSEAGHIMKPHQHPGTHHLRWGLQLRESLFHNIEMLPESGSEFGWFQNWTGKNLSDVDVFSKVRLVAHEGSHYEFALYWISSSLLPCFCNKNNRLTPNDLSVRSQINLHFPRNHFSVQCCALWYLSHPQLHQPIPSNPPVAGSSYSAKGP